MIADISQINLYSKGFAELVKGYYPIEELKDGVVYVKTNNDAHWNAAVSKIKFFFANCSMRGSWLMKYDIDVLPEKLYPNKESIVSNLMGTESNIIMPVFLPDRVEQYYFVGSVTNVEHLEPAVSFLSVDAQNLIEACFPYALSVMEENDLKSVSQGIYDEKLTDEWADEVKRLNERMNTGLSFRGLHTPNPLAKFGDAAVKAADEIKKGKVPYKKEREFIMNLPSAAKKLNSKDSRIQEEGKIEVAKAFEALDEHEKVLLLEALIKGTKPPFLKNIIATIADRETLGERTKYNIVFKPWEAKFKELGFDDNCKNCMFIKDGETLLPIKMQKSSMVIYTMALIEKVTKNKKYAIVDVKVNEKAFNDIYKYLFYDFNEDTIKTRYKVLFHRNTENPNAPIRTGRLSENYKDIEASLQNTFKNLEEDYSPFLTNLRTPLAINADKILLPQELMSIKIR